MASKYIDENGEAQAEPAFIKLYIKEVCNVKGLSGLQQNMFHFMLVNMNYDNIVSYGSYAKSSFIRHHDSSNATFNNNIKFLIKADLMERVGKGEFRVNKKYASRVEWSKVRSIVWTTKYTESGKTESVEFNEGK
jgi:hypothetical protein